MRKSNVKISKSLYWTPRLLSIIFILFLSLFSLDVFGEGLGFFATMVALLMHLIPSFVLTAALIVAWRHEWVGAVLFTLAGFAYIILLVTSSNFEWFMLSWSVIIAGPAFLIGYLFWKNWLRRKKKK